MLLIMVQSNYHMISLKKTIVPKQNKHDSNLYYYLKN